VNDHPRLPFALSPGEDHPYTMNSRMNGSRSRCGHFAGENSLSIPGIGRRFFGRPDRSLAVY